MKTLFLEARYKKKFKLPDSIAAKLAKTVNKIALSTTVQFLDSVSGIKEQLEKAGIRVELFKPKHCKYEGQLLGCSINTDANLKNARNQNSFLYIGDGLFHPIALKINNDNNSNSKVFAYNPFTKKLNEITEKETKQMKQQQKAALVRFYSSTEIGVLISTKPGQHYLNKAKQLEKKMETLYTENPNMAKKNFYYLLFDTLDFTQLENFPFIECFVNTACPRISYDDYEKFRKKIVDINQFI
ncbi:MAG: diphthamide synthesis protein [Candidatus Woesearchaeota archaeon]